jgi:hypothetical protein
MPERNTLRASLASPSHRMMCQTRCNSTCSTHCDFALAQFCHRGWKRNYKDILTQMWSESGSAPKSHNRDPGGSSAKGCRINGAKSSMIKISFGVSESQEVWVQSFSLPLSAKQVLGTRKDPKEAGPMPCGAWPCRWTNGVG